MKPRDSFEAAIDRAEHLLRLYELLHDTRQRSVRRDWSERLKKLMRWPNGERIVRVDGKDGQSLLILRESVGVDRQHFSHDYLSELLRAATVAAVSALDRYMHDIVVKHSWSLLDRPEADVPSELSKVRLSPLVAGRALKQLRSNPKARPGNLVKTALQKELHRTYTFQRPDDVLKAAKMLGIEDFWSKVAKAMPSSTKKGTVVEQLRTIAARRNQIVHEADLVHRSKSRQFKLRDLSFRDAREWVTWMKTFVLAVDDVIQSEF